MEILINIFISSGIHKIFKIIYFSNGEQTCYKDTHVQNMDEIVDILYVMVAELQWLQQMF